MNILHNASLARQSRDEFANWSGSVRFRPGEWIAPKNEEALQNLVRATVARHGEMRVAGTGHSSSQIAVTEDVLIDMSHFTGVLEVDDCTHQALIGAGTRLRDLGRMLHERGMGMENLGDVDTQTLAGVVGTGTHGSGRTLQNISARVVGVRAVTGTGEIVEWSAASDAELLRALRVSFGTLALFTAIRLQLLPAFKLRRRELCASIEDCLEHLDEMAAAHRNLDFYWYPRRDEVKIRTLNPPDEPIMALSFARCLNERVGFSHEVIARERELKFEELEYFVPAAAGVRCFREVRQRILERHRKHVGWRVLYRLVAADDAFLSPAFERDCVAISIHQNASLPYQEYFDDIEPILRAYDGRPHWGKKHSLRGAALAKLYPKWDRFQTLRRSLDPSDLFLSDDCAALFGEARRA